MPRTLAQNAQYIAETIKPAIKSAIEAQGVTVPSTDSFLDYADRIGEIEGGGSGYQLKDLPTGSISTVNDAAELPLNALKVSVEAWQEGSGDPSPSNIRPIHGWDSGEITVCDDIDNPTQTKTYTQQFPQTIYGAEWDVVDGSVSGDEITVTFDGSVDEDWIVTLNRFCVTLPYYVSESTVTINVDNCNIYKPTTGGNLYANRTTVGFTGVAAMYDSLYVVDNVNFSDNDLSRFKTWLSTNNLQVTLKLATPTTIDLSPLSIRMLQGTNNLYADCGEVIEGEYFVGSSGAYDLYDYIQSDGTQYINTGRKVNAGDTFDILYSVISAPSGGSWSTIWGAYDGNKTTRLVLISNNQKDRIDYGTQVDRTSYNTNNIYSDSFTVNNALDGDVYVFSGTNDIAWTSASIRLYSFAINDNYYLPVKRRSDGVFGLYDVANSQFLTDSASGNAFVGGNNLGVRIG